MYRKATERKIAELEKRVAWLVDLLGLDKTLADKMERSDFFNKSLKTFKDGVKKAVHSVGAIINDVKENSSKPIIMLEEFNEYKIVIDFDLLAESSLARKEVMSYKLSATFLDLAKSRGYYDLSFSLSVDGYPRLSKGWEVKVDASKGENGIAQVMKELVQSINKNTAILERL